MTEDREQDPGAEREKRGPAVHRRGPAGNAALRRVARTPAGGPGRGQGAGRGRALRRRPRRRSGESRGQDHGQQGSAGHRRPAKRDRGGQAGRRSSRGFVKFIREVISELAKVIWPTRRQQITYTIVVLVFVAGCGGGRVRPGRAVRQGCVLDLRLSAPAPAPPRRGCGSCR